MIFSGQAQPASSPASRSTSAVDLSSMALVCAKRQRGGEPLFECALPAHRPCDFQKEIDLTNDSSPYMSG
ncbi:MAG: hypothetical protein ABIY55_14905 [Kofleriaceae bacterium]